MTGTTIRRARDADAEGLATCMADEIRNNLVFVAERNGRIDGGVIASLSAARTGHIVNLGVRPEAAGRGLGRALVDHAVGELCDRGATGLHLATHAEMVETLAFYIRLGWEETGRDGNRVSLARPLPSGGR